MPEYSSLIRRKLYGSQWYLDKDSWMKSMQFHKQIKESLLADLKSGKKKKREKLEFHQMLNSIKFANMSNEVTMNPFRNRGHNFGSVYMLDEEKETQKKGDLHEKFVQDIYSYMNQ